MLPNSNRRAGRRGITEVSNGEPNGDAYVQEVRLDLDSRTIAESLRTLTPLPAQPRQEEIQP